MTPVLWTLLIVGGALNIVSLVLNVALIGHGLGCW